MRSPPGQRELTHAGLDELPDSKPLRHLRSVLVATGALPARDEHLVRLEQWITGTLAERGDPDQRALLRRYAIWHLLRRLRATQQRTEHASHTQVVVVQQHVRAAITLLDWLTARDRTLASARQGDLDTWLTSEHVTASPRSRTLRPLGQTPEADQPRLRRHQMGRPDQAHRHRGTLGSRPAGCCTTTASNPTTA